MATGESSGEDNAPIHEDGAQPGEDNAPIHEDGAQPGEGNAPQQEGGGPPTPPPLPQGGGAPPPPGGVAGGPQAAPAQKAPLPEPFASKQQELKAQWDPVKEAAEKQNGDKDKANAIRKKLREDFEVGFAVEFADIYDAAKASMDDGLDFALAMNPERDPGKEATTAEQNLDAKYGRIKKSYNEFLVLQQGSDDPEHPIPETPEGHLTLRLIGKMQACLDDIRNIYDEDIQELRAATAGDEQSLRNVIAECEASIATDEAEKELVSGDERAEIEESIARAKTTKALCEQQIPQIEVAKKRLSDLEQKLAAVNKAKAQLTPVKTKFSQTYGVVPSLPIRGAAKDKAPKAEDNDDLSSAIWAEKVFAGRRLQNARNFLEAFGDFEQRAGESNEDAARRRDMELATLLNKDVIMTTFGNLVNPPEPKKGMPNPYGAPINIATVIAIVTGYKYREEGYFRQAKPLNDLVVNEAKRAEFERVAEMVAGAQVDLRPKSAGASADDVAKSPVAAAHALLAEDTAKAEVHDRGDRAVKAGADPRAVKAGGSLLANLQRRMGAGGSEKSEEDAPGDGIARPSGKGIEEVERFREEQAERARRGDQELGAVYGLHGAMGKAAAAALNDEPKDEKEAEAMLGILGILGKLGEDGDIPAEIKQLTKQRTQVLLVKTSQRVAELEQKVEELETPENCLKGGGTLVDALKLFKEKNGKNPTTQDALGIIQRGLPIKTGQLRRQIPTALAEVEDWKPGKKGPRM